MFKKLVNFVVIGATILANLVVPASVTATGGAAENGLIAYVAHQNGGDGVTYELHVVEDDGSDVATGITSKYSMTLAWSPDGSKLALGMKPDYSYSESRIFVANADGTDLHLLTTLDGDQPTWSPDGQQIAFVSRRTDPTNQIQNYILYVMNEDGSNQHRLGTYPANVYHQYPKWSPDGQWLVMRGAISGFADTTTGIYRIAADGTGYQALVLDDAIHINANPSWTNDGQHILFTSNRDEATQSSPSDIYVMDKDGHNITRFAATADKSENLAAVTPDGAFVSYITSSPTSVSGLQFIELATGTVYEFQGSNQVLGYTIQPLFGSPVRWYIPPPPPLPDLDIVSVFRFWSARFNNAHFFTIDEAEATRIYNFDPNWEYEGDAFGAYRPVADNCRTHNAVYRFWSGRFQSHFFTSDAPEMNRVRNGDPNWNFEGIAYCADNAQQPGEVPLYRFWSSRFNKHFFTADPNEKNHLISSDPNWNYEGIAYYVYP